MKKNLPILVIAILICSESRSQLVSFTKIDSFTVQQLDSLLTAIGIGVFIQPEYAIDFYKVLYKTPYKHPDSLVRASGAVMIPKNVDCPLPLGAYLHGTASERTGVPSYKSPESNIGIFMASVGVMAALPDYLGLGDSDSSVIIHPYIHAFHQGNTSVNMLRAARQLADTLGVQLNGQLFLTGYSQGGFATVATHRLIESQFSDEFTITASAPMSGAYDLKGAQMDLILSDEPYATPSYLPYVLLAYHSIYPSLQQRYPNFSMVMKSPYDTLLPPLFYGKMTSTGTLNSLCAPVPKHMLVDSVLQAFENDTLHPFRLALAESHLLDWTPQAPIKLFYCNGDEQVTYLNSERAYDSWTSRGALHVEKQDFGNFSHGDCIQFALLGATNYLNSFRSVCAGVKENKPESMLRVFPNPAKDVLMVAVPHQGFELKIYEITGRLVKKVVMKNTVEPVHIAGLTPGVYVAAADDLSGNSLRVKFLVK